MVAAKYPEESRNTGTPPTGDDVPQQQTECRSGGSVRVEGAGQIQLLGCPLCAFKEWLKLSADVTGWRRALKGVLLGQ